MQVGHFRLKLGASADLPSLGPVSEQTQTRGPADLDSRFVLLVDYLWLQEDAFCATRHAETPLGVRNMEARWDGGGGGVCGWVGGGMGGGGAPLPTLMQNLLAVRVQSPGEIKRREVVLDPQVSPEEIKSR